MARIVHQNLFSWDEVDRSSDLYRLELVVEHLPDEEIVLELERLRGNGRDKYPVRAAWNALINEGVDRTGKPGDLHVVPFNAQRVVGFPILPGERNLPGVAARPARQHRRG